MRRLIVEVTEIMVKTYELKEQFINSDVYVDMKNKEKLMLEDKECFDLLCLYQDKQHEYNEAKRFEKYGSDVSKIGEELQVIKSKVYNNKYVKEYNDAYKNVNKIVKDIERIIFEDIIENKKQINIE